MLAEERFSLIMEQLNRKRTVTVQELCEALNTSESTIRRDLTELDRLGKLNKVHGGATLPDSRFLADEPTMAAKETLAVAQKRHALGQKGGDANQLNEMSKSMNLAAKQKRNINYQANISRPWHMETLEEFESFTFETNNSTPSGMNLFGG